MAQNFTLVGQAGKALDATSRSFEALKIRDVTLRFESIGVDTLAWTCDTARIDAGDTIVPEYGQTVGMFNNGGRVFFGHVTEVKQQLYGVRVVVSGPWWWMQQTPLSGNKDDQLGVSSERVTYAFPSSATVATNLQTLINRAIALGVPVAVGTIDGSYSIPQATLSSMSCADAFAELMRWVPDSVAWFDYTGGGTPTLNVRRRGAATDTTYAMGSDNFTACDVTARTELKTTGVQIKGATRDPNSGMASWTTLTSGATSGLGRQIITTAGPELDTYLPKDSFDSFKTQAVPVGTWDDTFKSQLLAMLPDFQRVRASFGGYPKDTDVFYAHGEQLGPYWNFSQCDGVDYYYVIPPKPQIKVKRTGQVINGIGKYIILDPNVPDWLQLPDFELVTLTATIYWTAIVEKYKSPYGYSDKKSLTYPNWKEQFGTWYQNGYNRGPTGDVLYDHGYWQIWYYTVELDCAITSQSIPLTTTFYKPGDYTFVQPPAGLAGNLLAAQNWTPWDGSFTLEGENYCDAGNRLNRKFNITGGIAGLATMAALPRAVSYDLNGYLMTIELGAPARNDYRTLVGRIRNGAQDNIIVLNS